MYPTVKRFIDGVVSLAMLMLISPFLLAVTVLVLLVDGRPVFFRQVRPGLNGEPFVMLKFRTMSSAPVPDSGEELARVTKLGTILRHTSIDELPSLWNIFRGDMSFVGPRPLLVEYLGIYSDLHAQRHIVRPGLTGLAQVAGRNLLSWKMKLDLDVVYVRNLRLSLDVAILLKTIVAVVRIRGVNQSDGSMVGRLTAGYESN